MVFGSLEPEEGLGSVVGEVDGELFSHGVGDLAAIDHGTDGAGHGAAEHFVARAVAHDLA